MAAFIRLTRAKAGGAALSVWYLFPGEASEDDAAHGLDELGVAAASLSDVQPPLFLDGIKVSNSPTDYRAIHNLQVTRFDGANWTPVGSMVDLDGIAS